MLVIQVAVPDEVTCDCGVPLTTRTLKPTLWPRLESGSDTLTQSVPAATLPVSCAVKPGVARIVVGT
jgi:hypothetical protein